MFPSLVFILLMQAASTPALFDASKATVSAATVLLELDSSKLKGNPVRLSWGEGDTLFLRVAETDRFGNERGKNYVIAGGKGEPSPVDNEPTWSAMYWSLKSGLAAPGVPTLRFDVETRQQQRTATGSTQDGPGIDNPNKSDPSQSQIAKDLASLQKVTTTTLRLKGHLVVEAVNQSVVPGLSFGWAPSPMGALAYADAKKRLVLLDREGHRLEVAGTSDVLLPAWSPDGKQVVFLQKKDRKKYTLNLVTIEQK